ncbi:MAG: cupin protein [Conexibacter sp.]|nr:cupin protein [Conexibacter sp.]
MSDPTLTPPISPTLPDGAVPYVQPAGTGRAHLLLGQVARTMIGAEQSNGELSVMTNCGPKGRPIPLHFHDRELEVFVCTRGRVQVWAGDESRVLSPGDMAVVPAGTTHAYQFHSHFSEFMGPITPGGWDRFFDLTGTPYDAPAFPPEDNSPPPFAKFGQAEHEFHMKYLPDAPYAPPTWDAADDALPGAAVPYFLRSGEGPRHLLGGQMVTTMVTAAESAGELGMWTVQGTIGAEMPPHVHERTHEAIFVRNGTVRVTLDGEQHVLTPGECASIPAGCVHTYAFESAVTRAIVMSAPGGLERLFALAGEPYEHHVFPAQPAAFPSAEAMEAAAAELDIHFVDA